MKYDKDHEKGGYRWVKVFTGHNILEYIIKGNPIVRNLNENVVKKNDLVYKKVLRNSSESQKEVKIVNWVVLAQQLKEKIEKRERTFKQRLDNLKRQTKKKTKKKERVFKKRFKNIKDQAKEKSEPKNVDSNNALTIQKIN